MGFFVKGSSIDDLTVASSALLSFFCAESRFISWLEFTEALLGVLETSGVKVIIITLELLEPVRSYGIEIKVFY